MNDVDNDDIYYEYFADNTQDSEEEDDDEESNDDNITTDGQYAYFNSLRTDFENQKLFEVAEVEDSEEIEQEQDFLRSLFAAANPPSYEQPREIIITNIQLNVINVGSEPILNDEPEPILVLSEETPKNEEKKSGLLLNFNLNLSEERTFLALAVLGIIISSICVTVFMARLQRKRLENLDGKN